MKSSRDEGAKEDEMMKRVGEGREGKDLKKKAKKCERRMKEKEEEEKGRILFNDKHESNVTFFDHNTLLHSLC